MSAVYRVLLSANQNTPFYTHFTEATSTLMQNENNLHPNERFSSAEAICFLPEKSHVIGV